jgi:hypothetical protein
MDSWYIKQEGLDELLQIGLSQEGSCVFPSLFKENHQVQLQLDISEVTKLLSIPTENKIYRSWNPYPYGTYATR